MEVHFDIWAPESWGNMDILKALADKFVNVNYHMNNYGCFQFSQALPFRKLKSPAFEVTLINKKLIKINTPTRSFKEHPLNVPNAPLKEDCQVEP